MSDIFKEAEENRGLKVPSSARVFLEFKYPEVRDLLKQFLTLISAALVFSVTFSEKIIDLEHASNLMKSVVIGAWGLLVLALGACGIGIYTIYLAAEQAIDTVIYDSPENYHALARRSYLFQDAAGVLFGAGMCLLVASSVIK